MRLGPGCCSDLYALIQALKGIRWKIIRQRINERHVHGIKFARQAVPVG